MRTRTIIWALVALLAGASPGLASDHADPIKLDDLEAGITGLFAWPQDGSLILVLCTRRALAEGPPYDLEDLTFTIHMDLHSRVSYTDAGTTLRYGGRVEDPGGISPDVTLGFRLRNDASLAEQRVEGIDAAGIRTWTGVRDDPFIFPPFFGTNVIAIVVSMPLGAFPSDQQDWLLWATTHRDGWFRTRQIDHVGRSNRTQLARFDFLNELPPSEHVAAIEDRRDNPPRLLRLALRLMPVQNLFNYLFRIRPYDVHPDVMVFTTRFASGFPNGRRLTDDVAALTCRFGDCVLQDLSYAQSDRFPRATANDKPFLAEFPFLAEPWPARHE